MTKTIVFYHLNKEILSMQIENIAEFPVSIGDDIRIKGKDYRIVGKLIDMDTDAPRIRYEFELKEYLESNMSEDLEQIGEELSRLFDDDDVSILIVDNGDGTESIYERVEGNNETGDKQETEGVPKQDGWSVGGNPLHLFKIIGPAEESSGAENENKPN